MYVCIYVCMYQSLRTPEELGDKWFKVCMYVCMYVDEKELETSGLRCVCMYVCMWMKRS